MKPLPKVTSKVFTDMLRESGITHVWLIGNRPPKGFRPGVDPFPKPTVKFINRREDRFVPPPAFLADFKGDGPYADQGRQINALKKTI